MIHEQTTITGELEITDSMTMKVIARRCTFTAERPCNLCGEKFTEGERIEVTFPAHCDLWSSSETGPWYPGGHTSRWLRAHATQIKKVNRGGLLLSTASKIMR
ncbi:MAG: hypothetical protein AB9903_11405 [Vulcanimicrobiota bacterium]